MMMKRWVTILCLVVIFFVNNCGPQKVKTEPGKKASKKTGGYIFYPPLPNTPRYQYLTRFSTSKDIKKKKSKFFKFVAGEEQEKPTAIVKPYGIDIYDGIIYVCDVDRGVVVTLNLKAREFGYLGHSGSGRLIKPVNVKVDKVDKQILVADIGRKQVMVYDLGGNFLRAYGKTGQFRPTDVDIFENKVFVCDIQNHQIHVLDRISGETLYKIGKAGSQEGELFHPTNICIEKNRLYISETTNFRIQIFSLEGDFIATLGRIGDRPGEFARNKGVAVDKEGRIYVVDSAFQNVQVFNKEFKLLLFMFREGANEGDIHLPAGIAIDYDNIRYFKNYISPKFEAEYLLFVTSNYGPNKVNVYAFGNYKNQQ
jgi:hypothetical protein